MEIFIPDNTPEQTALARCTHLAIGTHPDDVELLGMHGIQQCYNNDEEFFVGVVVTDGGGCPRSGDYKNVTDKEMIQIRAEEQIAAAKMGDYSAVIQLAYPSQTIKESPEEAVKEIEKILLQTQPDIIYLHNPLDRHASHRALLKACITALRNLPKDKRPVYYYGVEVWRSLDFLPNNIRVSLPTDKYPDLADKLLKLFKSQVYGGKRYDRGFAGRGLANATFAESHQTDKAKTLSFAVNLKPLIDDPELSTEIFARNALQQVTDELS